MKKIKKETEEEKDRCQQEIKLSLEEKKVIEDEIKNIGLAIKEKEEELKKINEKKYLHNIEREKMEKEKKTSASPSERREVEKKRWELEKKIADIVDVELEIGGIIFEKKDQLKNINVQYALLKEKILKMEENLALINSKIKYDSKEEPDKEEEIKKEKREETRDSSVDLKITKKEPPTPVLSIEKQKTPPPILIKKKELKDKPEEINDFFELFYKKIWLMVAVFDDDEKRAFREIILSGGADFIPEMAKYIQKKINQKFPNIVVKIADPSANVDDSSLLERPKKISQFSNAIGAAMKGFKN